MRIKSNALLVLVPVSSLLLVACDPAPTVGQTDDPSPEAPAARAGDLLATKGDGALVTRASPTIPGREVALLPTNSHYCTDKFVAYVAYPMTVCDWPIFEVASAAVARVDASPAPSRASLAAESSGLATASAVAPIVSPFCHVSGGPWYAEALTTQSCFMGVPDHSALAILGAPQPFSVEWDGDLSSVPPPFNPNSFAHFGQSCSCCPGFLSCLDGRCLPHGFSCDNNSP